MTATDRLLEHCREWAAQIHASPGAEIVAIFGSMVNNGGSQFDPRSSDLDLVVKMPLHLTFAPARTQWLNMLRPLKQAFELSLIPILGRADASKAIVSIVPVTEFELSRDIHKDGVRNFFRCNSFMDLLQSGATSSPLLNCQPERVDDARRQICQFAQTTRNMFLAVSASQLCPLVPWDHDSDPLPKDLMRRAAVASQIKGRKYDLQVGLDRVTNYLYEHRDTDPSYLNLHNWLSIRRGGRGSKTALAPESYMLFAEIILDMSRPDQRGKQNTKSGVAIFVRKAKGKQGYPKAIQGKSLGGGASRINGYKLFYFRLNNKWTLKGLARSAGLTRSSLGSLEKIERKNGAPNPEWFSLCSREVLDRLEEILECRGKLAAGKPDDFLTQYMMFYETYKGSSPSSRRDTDQLEIRFATKAVVFDFDGTLTQSSDYRTTWEKIWVALGYSTEDCFELHRRFQRKEFSHQEWCNRTRDAFRSRQLSQDHVIEIAGGISLVDGVAETLEVLHRQGIRLFILSGSIKMIIQKVLGELRQEFEEIKANEFAFDQSGILSEIHGTRYDFEGKAVFLRSVIADFGFSPTDVLFVGNSCNDVFASQSGARTLCVNARFTDPDNEQHWTYAIREMTDMREILKFVQL
jgi:HAD superfamily phosphoserine phosphatase-like hydrolase